jgi:hypothetical protein
VILVVLTLLGCQREERRFSEISAGAAATSLVVLNDQVQPGGTLLDPEARSAYEQSAGALVAGELDPSDGTAALGFANAMRDLKDATTRGGMLYVFALP